MLYVINLFASLFHSFRLIINEKNTEIHLIAGYEHVINTARCKSNNFLVVLSKTNVNYNLCYQIEFPRIVFLNCGIKVKKKLPSKKKIWTKYF